MLTEIKLSVGEKIKEIRLSKGISQVDMAAAVGYTESMVAHIERNAAEYSGEALIKAREFLGIGNAPLKEVERVGYKEKLLSWHNLIKNRQLDIAKDMREDLSCIKALPFERELSTLYDLINCRLLIYENELDMARSILKPIVITELDDELKFHYCYARGMFSTNCGDYKNAAKHYLKVLKLSEYSIDEKARFYANVAYACSAMGYPHATISYLQSALETYDGDGTDILGLSIDNVLALNYIRTHHFDKAKIHLDKCILNAKRANRPTFISAALHNYGRLCMQKGDWQSAIGYFDQAFKYYKEEDKFYIEAIYQKARCYVMMKASVSAPDLIAQGKKLSEGNKKYEILFNSLEHLYTIKNVKSCSYIENVTIPYLLELPDYNKALEYCDILRKEYAHKGRGFVTKSLRMADICRSILEQFVRGGYSL